MTATARIVPRNATRFRPINTAFREAITTAMATLACLACTWLLAPGAAAAVLAVVLCLTLARSQLDRTRRERIEALIVLPLVGIAATGVGVLLLRIPLLGACVFVAGMSLSIWLRRFGSLARRAGALIALPFVVLLVTPHLPASQASLLPRWMLPIVIALLSLLWVNVAHAVARRIGFLPRHRSQESVPAAPAQAGSMRPIASTRMAIQMAVALTLSFAAGFVFFAERWAWIVLTAYIVLSGNRGRLEVAYKSMQRVLGAAAGTVCALWLMPLASTHGATGAALMLTAVFLGVWLRPLNYAWWALFVTIALALLQGFGQVPPARVLPLRMEEIAIGAVIGLACACWILPVHATDVLRRRIADALAALALAFDPDATARTPDGFMLAVLRVQEMAPAFRLARRVSRRPTAARPADWIDVLLSMQGDAIALIERGFASPRVRRALGTARQSLREPGSLLSALYVLQETLSQQSLEKHSEGELEVA